MFDTNCLHGGSFGPLVTPTELGLMFSVLESSYHMHSSSIQGLTSYSSEYTVYNGPVAQFVENKTGTGNLKMVDSSHVLVIGTHPYT